MNDKLERRSPENSERRNPQTLEARRAFNRRAILVGAVPVAAAAVGAAGSLAVQLSRTSTTPVTPATAAVVATPAETATRPAATPQGVATPASPVGSPVAKAEQPPRMSTTGRELPEGTVLVASPRLPLAAVGLDDVWRLLNGEIADWAEVGSPISLPVSPFALSEVGGGPSETLSDYEALVGAFRNNAGAVALVPADVVDFRVQALSVGGVDALAQAVDGQAPIRIGVVGDIVPGRNVHLHMVQ